MTQPTPEERRLVEHFRLDPGWARALASVAPDLERMIPTLAGIGQYLPAGERVLRAFQQPFDQVKVLITGQDPYPTPGHAVGLSFSVEPQVSPVPRSLQNIFTEYCDDLGAEMPRSGDLSPWAEQGVCLLNRTLTVAPGSPASHQGIGWEPITECAVRALAQRGAPLVAILWGAKARELEPLLGTVPTVQSPHPSPLSAHRGFFGSKPFTRTNQLLIEQGAQPVDWSLP